MQDNSKHYLRMFLAIRGRIDYNQVINMYISEWKWIVRGLRYMEAVAIQSMYIS
jgi:hypothetical protein